MNTTPIIHRVEAELPPVGMKLQVLVDHPLQNRLDVEAVQVEPRFCYGFVEGLEWRTTDGSLVPIRKSDMWTYHPSLTAVIKLENELAEAIRQVHEYRAIATHLADCEAATAYTVGDRKSSPKCEKTRHASICRSTAEMLKAGYFTGRNHNQRYTSDIGIKDVIDRCNEAADLCEGKKA